MATRDFSIFWVGAFLSSIGFWVQAVGQGWQVLQLTNSALLLGFVGFAATLPNIVLSLFGGVVADRFNRRHLLLLTQTIYMCTATLLGVLTSLHIIAVWQIILIALTNGTFSTIGWPAWQAFIGELVEPHELKQGIALNSTQFNLSRVVGPAIGGFSIAMVGTGSRANPSGRTGRAVALVNGYWDGAGEGGDLMVVGPPTTLRRWPSCCCPRAGAWRCPPPRTT